MYYFPLRAFLEGERGSSEGALTFSLFLASFGVNTNAACKKGEVVPLP